MRQRYGFSSWQTVSTQPVSYHTRFFGQPTFNRSLYRFLDLLGELHERCLTGPESVPVNAVQSSETGGQEQEHGSFPLVRKL